MKNESTPIVMSAIDTSFDFRTDTPKGCDPDRYSKTLKRYHQALWSKELPNGEVMKLEAVRDPNYYLVWEDFDFGSDSIIVELRYKKYMHVIDKVAGKVGDIEAYYENLVRRSYTIGGMIIFPKHINSMNQMRGTCSKISDRWDLTLECIRRYYIDEKSPLSSVIESDKEFFDLFVDFKGYVDFFFLQDCVSEDYKEVEIWCGDASFDKSGLPETVDDYFEFIRNEHAFLDKRNERIKTYCLEHNI